jgi:hypothetical protein
MDKISNALKNYELMNDLQEGTATIQQITQSQHGIDGFVNWRELKCNQHLDGFDEPLAKKLSMDDIT